MLKEELLIKILKHIEEGRTQQEIELIFPYEKQGIDEVFQTIRNIDRDREQLKPPEELLLQTLNKLGVTNIEDIRNRLLSEDETGLVSLDETRLSQGRTSFSDSINHLINYMTQKLKVWVPITMAFVVCISAVIYVYVNSHREKNDDNDDKEKTASTENQSKDTIDEMEVSDDIDTIVESLIKISNDETEILNEEDSDASLITSDETEINGVIDSVSGVAIE